MVANAVHDNGDDDGDEEEQKKNKFASVLTVLTQVALHSVHVEPKHCSHTLWVKVQQTCVQIHTLCPKH